MKISRLVSKIPASPTLSIDAKVKDLRAKGNDIIGFGAGEPDFDTPEDIKLAAIEAIKNGKTKYTPVGGTLKLKEALCSLMHEEYGMDTTPENIIVSCGAKHSLFNLFLTLFEPGDEVICPAPYWVSYPPMIEMSGAKPVILDTRSTGMKLHADMVKDAITPRTKGIVINSPSNPTGMIFSRKEMEEIASLCVENDIIIISDDIYNKIIFNGSEFFSIATISPEVAKRTFVINGTSKTYAMTGWRIGYCIGDKDVIKGMTRLQSQSTSNPTSFAQDGAIVSLKIDQGVVEQRREIFEKRRDLIVSKIREIPGLDIISPNGSFYTFPSITGHLERFKTAGNLADFLLEKALVGVVPGEGFGAADHIRLSFATSEENIINGMNRIKEALSTL